MRKLISNIFFIVPCLLFAQGVPIPGAETIEGDLKTISSFYPRVEGSKGEKETIAFITRRLTASGTAFSLFDFKQSDSMHSFSSCIRVDAAGRLGDTLIVAVPLNSPGDRKEGDDGSANIALALELLRRLRETPPELSVIVLFLGAEFGAAPEYPMGSALFLSGYQNEHRTAVMYMNFLSVPQRVRVRGGGTGIVSPYWLMDRCVTALEKARIPFVLRGNENQIFRLGLKGGNTIIEPFLSRGYPSISLEGEEPALEPAAVRDRLSAFDSFFSSFLSGGDIPPEWDRHYLLFQEAGLTFLMTEKAYVAVLLLVLMGALLYSLVFRKGLKKYIRTLIRNSWSIVPILAIPFLFLLISTFALEGILALKGFPTLWAYSPMIFLLLKLCIPLLIYTALSGLIRKIPFSRKGSFYSAATLFFLIVDIVVTAALNISFSFYFLWAFVFMLLAAMTPARWGKFLLFPPSAFLGIRGLIEVFLMPALPFCRFLLLSPIRGNLLIAVVSLPFILYGIRLGLIVRGRGILRRRPRRIASACLLSAATVALCAYLLAGSPFGPANPQPVTITQIMDDTGVNRIELSSPAPIGEAVIRESTVERRMQIPGSHAVIPLSPRPIPVRTEVNGTGFLNKKNYTVNVFPDDSPTAISARLVSTEEFILLDCSFPFVRESAYEYRLLIGAYPPTPLEIQLTLPEGGSFSLTLTMDFDAPLLDVEVLVPAASVKTRLHYAKSLELRT